MQLKQITDRFCVDEHQILYDYLITGDINSAIDVLMLLDEMSDSDKSNKIRSYMKILLLHLIKSQVQPGKATTSWTISIENTLEDIARINKRRKTAGRFLSDEELYNLLEEAYASALRSASVEMRDMWRRHISIEIINTKIDKENTILIAFNKILAARSSLGL